jgi:catechol 2,3-dioxygenase-like lactoylglutathione lyase family enzyme
MIDHIGINISNFGKSKEFYANALAPLSYQLLREFEAPETSGLTTVAALGVDGKPNFWIIQGEVNTPRIHIAFRAETREMVQAFYEVALKIGGRDNGAPSLRTHYHPDYYGAFILDPDGHNIEAVCHAPV